jgi:hypothetical protein
LFLADTVTNSNSKSGIYSYAEAVNEAVWIFKFLMRLGMVLVASEPIICIRAIIRWEQRRKN